MTCKDCLHVEVCRKYVAGLAAARGLEIESIEELENIMQADDCEDFKSRDKVIELPCKAGDKLYTISLRYGVVEWNNTSVLASTDVWNTGDCKLLCFSTRLNKRVTFDGTNLGKSVFLTREEAEQALRERENHAE